MNKSDQVNEIAAALSRAQGAIVAAQKNSDNPFFSSRYADLAAVWEVARSPLASNGLAVYQAAESIMSPNTQGEEGIMLTTLLVHTSGQWISSQLFIRVDLSDPQKVGSATTYARRYALSAALGIAQEDDDAEAAMGRGSQQPPNRTHKPTKPLDRPREGPSYTRTPAPRQPKPKAEPLQVTTPTNPELAAQCKDIADRLGIPLQARAALFADCKHDMAEVLKRLKAMELEREEAEKNEADDAVEPDWGAAETGGVQ